MPESMPAALAEYGETMMNTFGVPQLVLERGEGVHVWATDGRKYLDLLGGIAVNALGYAHPALVEAVSVMVWPNPTTSFVNVSVSRPMQAELYDLMGQEIEKSVIPKTMQFVEEMPHTGMGKIDYRKLEKDYDALTEPAAAAN